MRHPIIPAFLVALAAPLTAQNVGLTQSVLVQSDAGEKLSLEVRCNPRDLDFDPIVRTDLENLDGIYETIGFGFAAEVNVTGGSSHSFSSSFSSIAYEEIPESTVLEAIRDGVRLEQTDLHLKFTGASTSNVVERRYPQAVVKICSLLATVCGDSDYALACGSGYVTRDASVLVEKLRMLIDEHENPDTQDEESSTP